MLFYLIDLATSICLNMIVSIGSFVVYKSFSGMYYIYKLYSPSIKNDINNIDNNVYVVLSESEYMDLINNKNTLSAIEKRLESIENREK